MLLSHPTIYAISVGGIEYHPTDGVFDLPDSVAEIAMNWFGFTEAKRGRAKRAKASAPPPSAKAKPRSRKAKPKPRAKPQSEEMKDLGLVVTSSYSLTPTFSFSGPGFDGFLHPVPEHDTSYELQGASDTSYKLQGTSDTSYELQGTSYKMKTVASDLASGIHRSGDRNRYETFPDARPCALRPYRARWARGEVIRQVPSSAPCNTVARYGYPTGPSPGAYPR